MKTILTYRCIEGDTSVQLLCQSIMEVIPYNQNLVLHILNIVLCMDGLLYVQASLRTKSASAFWNSPSILEP